MKNEHVLPQTEVPEELRLEIYKEALRLIETDNEILGTHWDYGLCLLLPCILWDLDSFTSRGPKGKGWNYRDTTTMFPEIEPIVCELVEVSYLGIHYSDLLEKKKKMRMKGLKTIIEELSSRINNNKNEN